MTCSILLTIFVSWNCKESHNSCPEKEEKNWQLIVGHDSVWYAKSSWHVKNAQIIIQVVNSKKQQRKENFTLNQTKQKNNHIAHTLKKGQQQNEVNRHYEIQIISISSKTKERRKKNSRISRNKEK